MLGPNFENSFIQQCLLGTYYVPATILATEDVTVNKRANQLWSWEVYIWVSSSKS